MMTPKTTLAKVRDSATKGTPTPHKRVGVSFLWIRDLERRARVRVSKVAYILLVSVWPIVIVLGLPFFFDSMVFILLGLVLLTMAAICRLAIVENENHIESICRLERLETVYLEFIDVVEKISKENSEN